MRADGHAVESTCRVLREQGCQVAARTYRALRRRRPAARTISDAQVVNTIRDIAWTINAEGRRVLAAEGLYGRRKMTAYLRRTTTPTISSGAVDRAMRVLGLVGVRRDKGIRTTTPAKDGKRAGDLLNRDFTAAAPNQVWVTDFTYAPQLGRVLLRGLHRRRVRPEDRGLARRDNQDHRTGHDTVADGAVAARPRGPPDPARSADSSLRRRQPRRIQMVVATPRSRRRVVGEEEMRA